MPDLISKHPTSGLPMHSPKPVPVFASETSVPQPSLQPMHPAHIDLPDMISKHPTSGLPMHSPKPVPVFASETSAPQPLLQPMHPSHVDMPDLISKHPTSNFCTEADTKLPASEVPAQMSDQHVEGHSAMTQHAALYATVPSQLDTKPSANDITKPSFQCTHLQSCQPMHSTAFQTQPEYALPNAQGNDHI
jgi:hypothetical protein